MSTAPPDSPPGVAASANRPRILIADDSRISRASITQRIRDRFDIREATDGEAAWQAILLDASIRVVVTDIAMPKADGFDLLTRVRSSKVQRVRELPIIVMAEADETAERERAARLGATDFLTKGTDALEVISRLDVLVRLSSTRKQLAETQATLESARTIDPDTELLSLAFFDKELGKLVSHARRNVTDVALICIRVDLSMPGSADWDGDFDQRIKLVGRTLAASIRLEDLGTRSDRAEFVVATPSDGISGVLQFAARLRRVLENVESAGPGVQVWTCIGVASLSEELRRGAEELRATAQRRAAQAQANRSRRIVLGTGEGAAGAGEVKPAEGAMEIQLALALIRAGRAGEVVPHLPRLIEQISPLLRLLKQQQNLPAQDTTPPGIKEGTDDELQGVPR